MLNYKLSFQVVSKFGLPYFHDETTTENGTIVRGYAVDLVEAIMQKIKEKEKIEFQYEFYRAPGNEYGDLIKGSKKWNGIIGELMDHVINF